jgi:hypothetical protein
LPSLKFFVPLCFGILVFGCVFCSRFAFGFGRAKSVVFDREIELETETGGGPARGLFLLLLRLLPELSTSKAFDQYFEEENQRGKATVTLFEIGSRQTQQEDHH